MTENANFIKCVAVGDGYIGKTCLLTRLAEKDYHEDYAPTIFENSSIEVRHNDQLYDIHFIDTAGQEGYETLRSQVYTNVNVFLVCFSISNADSFSNITEVWLPDIRRHSKGSALILVGTKSDLRDDPETIDRMNISNEIFVSPQMAANLANRAGMKYIECSSRTQVNIGDVRSAIIEAFVTQCQQQRASSPRCISPVLHFINRLFCCKIC